MKFFWILAAALCVISCSDNNGSAPADNHPLADQDNQANETDLPADHDTTAATDAEIEQETDLVSDNNNENEPVESDAVTDTDTDIASVFAQPKHGRISVFAMDTMSSEGVMVAADLWDRPVRFDAFAPLPGNVQTVALQKGACTLYKTGDNACNPPCGPNEFCNSSNTCETMPARISAGDITVTDPYNKAILIMSGEDEFAFYAPTSMPNKGFNEGATFSAQAKGDKLAQFSLSLAAPKQGRIDTGDSQIALFDDKDTVITWTKTGQPDEKIAVILNFGWHGAPPEATILCETDDAAGTIVIDKEISKNAPLAGGIGLLPHPSYAMRFKQTQISVDNKTIELLTAWEYSVSPLHE